MSNYGGSGGSGGYDPSKPQALYGVWIHGQIKNILDQARQRTSEITAEQKADVEAALQSLEQALSKVQRHAQ
jgi:hypothetical protein